MAKSLAIGMFIVVVFILVYQCSGDKARIKEIAAFENSHREVLDLIFAFPTKARGASDDELLHLQREVSSLIQHDPTILNAAITQKSGFAVQFLFPSYIKSRKYIYYFRSGEANLNACYVLLGGKWIEAQSYEKEVTDGWKVTFVVKR